MVPLARIESTTPEARIVRRGLQWLTGRQNADGSWGTGTLIQRVVCTCQAILTLVAAGLSLDCQDIALGLRWLLGDEVENADNRYQRAAPLISCGRFKEAEEDLNDIRSFIREGGFGPFPSFSLQMFLYRCLVVAGMSSAAEEVRALANQIVLDQDDDGGWRKGKKSIVSTAFGLWALTTVRDSTLREREDKALEYILDKVAWKRDPVAVQASWDSNVASTAYVMMDLLASGLQSLPKVEDVLVAAKNYIVLRQEADGGWPRQNPPFGGEVQNREYFAAVALRGLISFYRALRDDFLDQVHLDWIVSERSECRAMKGRYVRRTRIFGLIASLLAILSASLLSLLAIPIDATSIGIAASLATVVSVIWTFGHELWTRLTREQKSGSKGTT